MDKKSDWELYRSFLAVLDEGSLSKAANMLGVAQPTIGRHIAELEKGLGLTLFTRSKAGMLPTEVARDLQPYAQEMRSTVAALHRAAENRGDVSGPVRVTASDAIGVEVLPPILKTLCDRYEGLTVELVLSNRMQDLLSREADIAVRMVRPEQGALVARRVGDVELGMFAHADYLAKHGSPASMNELQHHSLIGFDVETPFLRAATGPYPAWRRSHFTYRTDDDLAQLALLRAGAGIAVCQVGIALRDSSLVRLFPGELSLGLDTWVTMHGDLRASPRCRASFDAIYDGLKAYLAAS